MYLDVKLDKRDKKLHHSKYFFKIKKLKNALEIISTSNQTFCKFVLYCLQFLAKSNILIWLRSIERYFFVTYYIHEVTQNPQFCFKQNNPFRVWVTFRYGKPHEIGGAVAFLASDDASYMIGEAMVVGGGWDSRL